MLDAHPPTFTPLASPRSFRLLKLLALRVPVIQEQRYGLTLCNFHLDNCPEYLALSYTWRKALYLSIECTEDEDPQMSTEEPCQVLLGHVPAGEDYTTGPTNITGSLFTITENLLDALVQLASSGYADKWLWIDALCIDQSNSDEKGIQVAMMGEIYSKASQVIVWLGSDTSNLEDFLWLNTEFLAGIGHYIQEFGVEDLMKQTPFSYKLLEFMKLQPPSGDWVICWENYMSFCRRRRWFSRIVRLPIYVRAETKTFIWIWQELDSNIYV
ncbi:hypothetical protein IFR05_002075 [Cadophora sp. M221]|nr:hypothetical protein IFR05_002075 [Cadophora sp. M221]